MIREWDPAAGAMDRMPLIRRLIQDQVAKAMALPVPASDSSTADFMH